MRDSARAGGLREEVSVGCAPGDIVPEWNPRSTERPPERLPLSIGQNNVGLLVLRGARPAPSEAESRILRALGDQLALVLERDRLLRTATDAEVYRQTERLRQTLLAAVSHDLRSPLAAIKASVSDLLEEGVTRSPDQQREALEAIDSESDRLNALIANLLDMSRIEAGVLRAGSRRSTWTMPSPRAPATSSRVWPDLTVRDRVEDGVMVRADPVFLDRVLTNLLDNAARSAKAARVRRRGDVQADRRTRHDPRDRSRAEASPPRRARSCSIPSTSSISATHAWAPVGARDRERVRRRDGR